MTQLPFKLREHEPMARHTSWRIGGPARYYAEIHSVDEALALVAWAAAEALPLIWVGGGTNLLVADAGFPGVLARLRAQRWDLVETGDTARLISEAGAPMAGTARRISAMGWAGLEWAEGVPGTIGGAVYGNAGCYGGDVATQLISAKLLVGDTLEEWPAANLAFDYRESALKRMVQAGAAAPLVLEAVFRLNRADPQQLAERMASIAAERKRKTPWGSSCGSVFKNPPGQSAGRLIELAGCKGKQIGGAQISDRHANYIVNQGDARSADILGLIDYARNAVREQFGIALELEVRLIGVQL
jgi:UDP-N-acetylmuramate dehydrogenase